MEITLKSIWAIFRQLSLLSDEEIMVKLFFKTFIPACLLLLILPVSTLAFPKFDILPKGGIKLEEGQMRWGRILFHPGFAFETKYDDNVFETANKTFNDGSIEGREEDVIFTNKPSFGIELQRGAGDVFGFNLEYEGEDEHFLGLNKPLGDDLDGFNHYVAGDFNFGGPGGRGDITLGGSFDKSNNLSGGRTEGIDTDELGQPITDITKTDLSSNIGKRVDNETVEGFLDIIYSPSKIFKLKLRADVESEEYADTNSSQDADTYNFGGSFFWQATPVVAYGVRYNHKIIDYKSPTSSNDNSDSDQVYLALQWALSKLISTELAVGFDIKRFDKFSSEDREDLVFQIRIRYRPTKRTRLSLRAYREIIDSSFRTIQTYVSTTFRLRLVQGLGKKFKVDVRSRYQNRDYGRSVADTQGTPVAAPTVFRTRVDNHFTGSVALIYEIQKWLEARAKYRYETNASNFDASDYSSNVGILEISAKY